MGESRCVEAKTQSAQIFYEELNLKINNTQGEKGNFLLEINQKLIAEIALLEDISKKKDQTINNLIKENSNLKAATESLDQLRMRINIYERIDFQSILKNSDNKRDIKNEILTKIRNIESDYGKEIITLKRKIEKLIVQIDNLNNNSDNNNKNNFEALISNNDFITKKDCEIMDMKIKLARAQINSVVKLNQEKRFEEELKTIRIHIDKLMVDNDIFNLSNSILQLSTNSKENTFLNLNNNNDSVKESLYKELEAKYDKVVKISETLQGELDSEKNKYLSLLEMNQDLAKKVIENMKILNINKSEIMYLKKKVAEEQKEKGDSTTNNDLSDNSICLSNNNNNYIYNYIKSNTNIINYDDNADSSLIQEECKKVSEMRLQLEKICAEQKLKILELIEQHKLLEQKIQTITEELKLEKVENENLKEIQKIDLKNISKILSENGSQQKINKSEELIQELKASLQNTNKINVELANKKKHLEKEITGLRLKLREQSTSTDKGLRQNSTLHNKDDKSIVAFSKFSLGSNLTNSKFFDSKIKELEDSLLQEKENSENLLRIKQQIMEKLKKSNENLLTDRSKLMRELTEEKMKNKSLQLENKTMLEREDYLKAQIQELNAEICDLKLYQENYELIEEKMEELHKQFANLVNVYDNPHLQIEHFQKVVKENVDLNAYKTKYFQIECEMQEKNKDILLLKEKIFCLEIKATKKNNEENIVKAQQLEQVSNSNLNSNNINFNCINCSSCKNINNEKCGNCNFLETNLDKYKQILDEYNKKTCEYLVEISELKKTIEDNRLVIFSLREKCKDMISKDKEILRLNTIITELNNRKKKKVSFGKEIVLEFQKENSPSEPVNHYIRENELKQKDNNKALKLSDLLKSQEHLYEKYQKEFDSLKNYKTSILSLDASENSVVDNVNLFRNIRGKCNNNYAEQSNTCYQNQNQINNNNSLESKYRTTEIQINLNNSRKQEVRAVEEQKENSESVFTSDKINIESCKNLTSNLEFEFDRIKNKYELAEGQSEDAFIDKRRNRNTVSLEKNTNSIFRNFCEKLNIVSMSKSDIFSTEMFEKVQN